MARSAEAAGDDARVDGSSRALVLTGGGARAAYQVGLLRGIGRQFPELEMPIITGISAGAINAVFLAAHPGNFAEATDDLARVWRACTFDDVFRTDVACLARGAGRWLLRLVTAGRVRGRVQGLLDTTPLRGFLQRTLGVTDAIHGIGRNLARGRLRAVALATLDYRTGETVTWVQGDESVTPWNRPQRHGVVVRQLTVDHVMASSALPLIFPAIRLGGAWYGDGGIRLAAPISPAMYLGADRVLAVSTRYQRSRDEIDGIADRGYPPPAQIVGKLFNAVFLDVLDTDARRIQRLNSLLTQLPADQRDGMRPIDVLLLRPSVNVGRLVSTFEPRLPKGLRFLTRGLGTREAASPDFLSMLMFQDEYLDLLIETGERDAASQADEIARWVDRTRSTSEETR